MNDEIAQLEKKREHLYRRISELGDFRRGSISESYRHCGKKNCACAKPGHKGHGPQYLWTATIQGKREGKTLHLGPILQKYLEETDQYREFKRLCKELIEVNERLCDLRPVPVVEDVDELADLKKKLQNRFRKRSKRK